jgi:hypothetical protein
MSRKQSILYLFLALVTFAVFIFGESLLSGYAVRLKFLPDGPTMSARIFFGLASILFLIIGAIGLGRPQPVRKPTSQAAKKRSSVKRVKAATPSRVWAIAAGANLARRNSDNLEYLDSGVEDPRQLLSKWWGVNSAEDFQQTLSWLEQEGHRKRFRALYQQLSRLSASEASQFIGQLPTDSQKSAQFVWENMRQFAKGDLIAWDFARLINVCRFGYAAGYISEDTAWTKLLSAAQQIQASYGSWQEMSDNYDWGWRFWQNGAPLNNFSLEASNWLKTSPDSPWQKLAWNTVLY